MSDQELAGFRYLWWPEFQRRGALHYHAVLVDPPFGHERDARRWFDAHWTGSAGQALAGIQTWVEYRSADWFRKAGGDYVLKDVRKIAGKRYEQDYTRMPKGWRTCSNNRLEFELAEHVQHESKAYTVCTAAPDASWHERQQEIWVYRVDHHVPARHGCYLGRARRHNPKLQASSNSPALQETSSRQGDCSLHLIYAPT